jgi:hypothetical protein
MTGNRISAAPIGFADIVALQPHFEQRIRRRELRPSDRSLDMSAVSLVNIAAPSRVAAKRVIAARRTAFSIPDRRSTSSVPGSRARPVAMAAAARDENPKATSPIVRMATGAEEPSSSVPAAREPLLDRVGAVMNTLWGLRKGVVMLAFALGLALVDAGPALAGRGGRSGGRMGGSSFRSTSARSMGGGMGAGSMGGGMGAGAMGAGAMGGAGAQRQGMGMGMGMGPRFMFMPSFGMGYGMGAGPMYAMGSVLRLLMNVWLMFMVYQFLFGGRPRNGPGSRPADV